MKKEILEKIKKYKMKMENDKKIAIHTHLHTE
jgi:hypothetical protein